MHDMFYFTDIHGDYNLFKAIITWCKKQDNECTIIFGGDACDRGEKGYTIMQELLNDPHVIYLKGNHEDLFISAAKSILKYNFHSIDYNDIYDFLRQLIFTNENVRLSSYNGGISTLIDWMTDNQNLNIIDSLDNLPITFSYGKYDFCHAGGNIDSFIRVWDSEYKNEVPDAQDAFNLLWDRAAFLSGWITNRICIHGHTPILNLPKVVFNGEKGDKNYPHKLYGVSQKYSGYRIDMDCGTPYENKCFVLNVNTQKVYEFLYNKNKTAVKIANRVINLNN